MRIPAPALWATLLAAAAAASLASRRYIPIDETRYVSVAWEMWQANSFLVPIENGTVYSHKPPLLFWLIHAGWAITGVNDWTPRLISPLFAWLSLFVCRAIARRTWPGQDDLASGVPLVLLGSALWLAFSQSLMFDILLGFCVLLGILALVARVQTGDWRWWLMYALAIGLGGLSKGPVVLLHLLPPALLAPWWAQQRPDIGRWYGSLAVALLLGAGITLLWAIPAGIAGGEDYRNAIFLGQTLDRVAGPAPHARPFWWYLPLLPLLLFPWLFWPPVYRGIAGNLRRLHDPGLRLALSWALPPLLGFMLISGKQVHYLVPTFPAWALLITGAVWRREERQRPWLPAIVLLAIAVALSWPGQFATNGLPGFTPSPWLLAGTLGVAGLWLLRRPVPPRSQVMVLSVGMIMAYTVAMLTVMRPISPAFDVRPMAQAINAIQASGKTVVHDGHYPDLYHFAGRLTQPLVERRYVALRHWLREHPHAVAVTYVDSVERLPKDISPLFTQALRGDVAVLLTASDALRLLNSRKSAGHPPD